MSDKLRIYEKFKSNSHFLAKLAHSVTFRFMAFAKLTRRVERWWFGIGIDEAYAFDEILALFDQDNLVTLWTPGQNPTLYKEDLSPQQHQRIKNLIRMDYIHQINPQQYVLKKDGVTMKTEGGFVLNYKRNNAPISSTKISLMALLVSFASLILHFFWR